MDFYKVCHKSIPSKFWQKGDSHNTINTEFHSPFEWFLKGSCFNRFDCYGNASFIILIILLIVIENQGHFDILFENEMVCIRDVRVQILIWFRTILLSTKPIFQTFNALKSTSFQAFFRPFLVNTRPNRMGSSLTDKRNSSSFIILYDFSYWKTISFAIPKCWWYFLADKLYNWNNSPWLYVLMASFVLENEYTVNFHEKDSIFMKRIQSSYSLSHDCWQDIIFSPIS